jgi:hypothetical protein
MCGIYIIYKDKTPIYVGISKNIRKRFSTHDIKDWDYVKVKPAATFGEAHDLETKLIKRIKPKLNSYGLSRSSLGARPRVSIAPDTYNELRKFCMNNHYKIKDFVNEILSQALKGIKDDEQSKKKG